MLLANTSASRPAPTPLDPGGAKRPKSADPAPMAKPSYKDVVGKLQKATEFKPFANPVTPSRTRERSPTRGERRPIEVQRRPKKDSAAMFPGGGGREEALSKRSKTIPKESAKQFYIGEQERNAKLLPTSTAE